MLGKLIRVSVTDPIGSPMAQGGYYKLNHGKPTEKFKASPNVSGVLILGIDNPVRNFDGRVIAIIKFTDNDEIKLVAAPKSRQYINWEIELQVGFIFKDRPYTLSCYYERSCGAVVYRKINDEYRFLLIKNKRSANWSFPKGHVELHETLEQTAKREVLEETGLHIKIHPGFKCRSDYSIQNRIQKAVHIFVGTTKDTKTIIQPEEIDSFKWLMLDKAIKTLRFENDKAILQDAYNFLIENNYIREVKNG